MGRCLLIIVMLLLVGCGHRQLKVNQPEGSDFFILQNNEPASLTAGRDILLLKPAPFTIVSRNPQMAVTLSDSTTPISFTEPGIDTAGEHRSPFYVWKAYPTDRRADYLIIGEGHMLLSPDNGLRPVREGLYAFTVRQLYDAGRNRTLSLDTLNRPIKAVFWIDKNHDLVIDDNELRQLELVFTTPRSAS